MAKTFLSSKTLTVLLNLFPLCRWHTQKIEPLYGKMAQMAAHGGDCPHPVAPWREGKCAGTPVTRSGTKARKLHSRISVKFGEERSSMYQVSLMVLRHQNLL